MLGSFRLDHDQRNALYGLVQSSLSGDWLNVARSLYARIEASVSASLAASNEQTRPEDQARLRHLVRAIAPPHIPSIGLMRTRIFALSPSIIRQIEARASRVAVHN